MSTSPVSGYAPIAEPAHDKESRYLYASGGTTSPTHDDDDLENGHGHGHAHGHPMHDGAQGYYDRATDRAQVFVDRLRGKGRRKVGWVESLRNMATASWVNIFLLIIPFAWTSHFDAWPGHASQESRENTTFILCFLAIIPLEALFDWGGEQMALFLGKDLGDLLVITLNNAVEATLAIILLLKCELRLLQSTIVGVVILHLLLIPGTAFLVGGSHISHQSLHPAQSELNHSLLTIGVLATLLPTAFFAALDRGAQAVGEGGGEAVNPLVNDLMRDNILKISRGISIMLLIVYIASRIYMHNPPGEANALKVPENAPDALKHEEHHLAEEEPLTNPWACMIMLIVTVAIMGVTAEFLVESAEHVREEGTILSEFFGIILLPIVSFSADGTVAIVFFVQASYNHIRGKKIIVPSALARGRAIDLSIQFTLWWMPFLVLLGWWTLRPMHLLFDYYEVALLLGSCFLVNYVTADAKTNWVEGVIMVMFYFMIATTTWFYAGQPEVMFLNACHGTVASAVAGGLEALEHHGGEAAAEHGTEAVEHAARALMGVLGR